MKPVSTRNILVLRPKLVTTKWLLSWLLKATQLRLLVYQCHLLVRPVQEQRPFKDVTRVQLVHHRLEAMWWVMMIGPLKRI